MHRKTRQTCAKRQGYCVSAKLTLEEYVKLEELVVALGTNRSAWIREIIQANLAMQKNIGITAQPPP
jgi:predicted DNA-binding protein